jgi:hypothetical protein
MISLFPFEIGWWCLDHIFVMLIRWACHQIPSSLIFMLSNIWLHLNMMMIYLKFLRHYVGASQNKSHSELWWCVPWIWMTVSTRTASMRPQTKEKDDRTTFAIAYSKERKNSARMEDLRGGVDAQSSHSFERKRCSSYCRGPWQRLWRRSAIPPSHQES